MVCRNDLLRKLTLVDTPGFDACDDDDGIASRILSEASLVIYVHRGNALYSLPPPLRQLQRQGTKVLFLYNRDDDQSDRGPVEIGGLGQLPEGFRGLCHEDPDGLQVLGGGREPSRFEDRIDLLLLDGFARILPGGVPLCGQFHEGHASRMEKPIEKG